MRILVLLMRWSGLRISDAVALERTRLVGNNLFLYQAKTGLLVYVPLPPDVAESLRNIPPGAKQIFGILSGLTTETNVRP